MWARSKEGGAMLWTRSERSIMTSVCRVYSSFVTAASMRRRDCCVDFSSSLPKKMMVSSFSQGADTMEVEGLGEQRLRRQDPNPKGDPKPPRATQRTMTLVWCDVV